MTTEDRDGNHSPTEDELRAMRKRRAERLMPDWALAKEASTPEPSLKTWFAELKQKLFGDVA